MILGNAYLSELVLIKNLSGYSAADTTTINGSSVDMQTDNGYDSVLFWTLFGTAASDNTLKGQGSSDDSSFSDLANTQVGVGSSDEIVWLDIHRPQHRYLRPVALRGTSTTLVGIWGLLYNAKKLPTDNTVAGTIHGEAHQSPAAGTA